MIRTQPSASHLFSEPAQDGFRAKAQQLFSSKSWDSKQESSLVSWDPFLKAQTWPSDPRPMLVWNAKHLGWGLPLSSDFKKMDQRWLLKLLF